MTTPRRSIGLHEATTTATSRRPSGRIETLLVANRGEIARRIFRTARSMGIRSVAVYVDADADAPFVHEADEAVLVPTGYLDSDAIVAAAGAVGADAVHPGYGFLSENAAFAADVIGNDMVWVGPGPAVIEAMGDKIAAKAMAVRAGVAALPSALDPSDAGAVGYPLLVKAAAGGGGRGMRVVAEPTELYEAVAAARRESARSFGDDRVFLERYLPRSRHVEIQILGDRHGQLVHLGERECSIQRRHQKIIEESPSTAVDGEMRGAMGAAALALGRILDYESLGTVEFLLDDETRQFWFLEVNTRLQVEHTVTEEVTGIDLVREQLRVAAGEPLGYGQDEISFAGHAVQARLYAEDPAAGFLPARGTLAAFAPPSEPIVRWDRGVERGSVVGVEFDAMLAKVVAHAPSRSEAVGRLALALEQLHIGGVVTNRDFLVATLRSAAFAAGDTTTDFIERVDPPRRRELRADELARVAVAAALWLQGSNRREAESLAALPSGWRNSRFPPQRVELGIGDQSVVIHYRSRRDGTFAIGFDADKGTATVHRWSPDLIDIEWGGRWCAHRVSRSGADLHLTGCRGTVTLVAKPRFELRRADPAAGELVAPMPGVVLYVRVEPGEAVRRGQTLVVIEAMKMEHHIDAGVDGIVTEVHVETGQQLDRGTPLLVIEPVAVVEGESSPDPGGPG